MEDDQMLLSLLKDFIKEAKESAIANADGYKEINECLTKLKLQVSVVEGLCQSSVDIRRACFKKQDDFEIRLREVEVLKPLKNLPKKFEDLAINVYKIMGASAIVTAIIMIIAGIIIRNSIAPGI